MESLEVGWRPKRHRRRQTRGGACEFKSMSTPGTVHIQDSSYSFQRVYSHEEQGLNKFQYESRGFLISGLVENMVRSDQAEWWFNAVYSAVQEVWPSPYLSFSHMFKCVEDPLWACYKLRSYCKIIR